MKKILFVLRQLGMCGNERMMLTYISEFYQRSEIYVLSLKSHELLLPFLPEGIKYINLDKNINVHLLNENFDIEIATSEFDPHEWIRERNSSAKKILMVATCLWDNRRSIQKIQQSLEIYDKFIFVSQYQYNKFLSTFQNINKDNCHVIYNMLNLLELKKLSCEPIDYIKKGFTIGIFGRLSYQKNLCEILHILSILKRRTSLYVLYVGSGSEKQYLLDMVNKFHLNNNVDIIDFKINPYPYINICDIVFSSSKSESFGLTMLEAILLNKIPMTISQEAKNEVLQDGKLGFIYNDIHEACAQINEIHNSSKKTMQIRKNIQKYIENYDYKEMIENFWKIILNLFA